MGPPPPPTFYPVASFGPAPACAALLPPGVHTSLNYCFGPSCKDVALGRFVRPTRGLEASLGLSPWSIVLFSRAHETFCIHCVPSVPASSSLTGERREPLPFELLLNICLHSVVSIVQRLQTVGTQQGCVLSCLVLSF